MVYIVKDNGHGCFAHCSPTRETIQHMIDRIHVQKLFKITKNHESPVPLTKGGIQQSVSMPSCDGLFLHYLVLILLLILA